jgi:hypothetical protein
MRRGRTRGRGFLCGGMRWLVGCGVGVVGVASWTDRRGGRIC